MSDALPAEKVAPLSEEERWQRAEDWSDYRKLFDVSPNARERSLEFLAFCAGWDARRNRVPDDAGRGDATP